MCDELSFGEHSVIHRHAHHASEPEMPARVGTPNQQVPAERVPFIRGRFAQMQRSRLTIYMKRGSGNCDGERQMGELVGADESDFVDSDVFIVAGVSAWIIGSSLQDEPTRKLSKNERSTCHAWLVK